MKRNRMSCYFDLSESFVRMSDTDSDTEVGEAIRNPYRPAFLFLPWTFRDLIMAQSRISNSVFSKNLYFFLVICGSNYNFFNFIRCRHNIKMQGGSSLWGVAQDSCRCPRRPRCKFLIWKWRWRWDWISWPSHGGWHLCLQTVPVMHLPKKWSGSMTFWIHASD